MKQIIQIDPDEIFLDSHNLPDFNKNQFEGRIVSPIKKRTLIILYICACVCALLFAVKLFSLQVIEGKNYAIRTEENRLQDATIFANRGTIVDRLNLPLAWNDLSETADIANRVYATSSGLGHIIGYVKYPKKDKSGNYFSYKTEGKDGVEKYFDTQLTGENGVRITEVNVKGDVLSKGIVRDPKQGQTIKLSIDSRVQAKLSELLAKYVQSSDFIGGAGVLMNVKTGEIIAIASNPDYDSSILTEGSNSKVISNYFNDPHKILLDRAVSGLYAPGSTIKPFLALAALNEHVITPDKKIFSSGALTVPNPYFPDKPTIFKDWKAHGWVNMFQAIANSSDVYFYEVGGGFQDQAGLGIERIEKYVRMFGFGSSTTGFFEGPDGVIPNPDWKAKNFKGDKWLIGDTYHASIGQYGFQVTPLQMARAIGAIVRDGFLVQPTLLLHSNQFNLEGSATSTQITTIDSSAYSVVKEGLRQTVTHGTAPQTNIPGLEVMGKTGTAELGSRKQYINSWYVGAYPYSDPTYSFAIVLEKGPYNVSVGAPRVLADLLQWMKENTPEYTTF